MRLGLRLLLLLALTLTATTGAQGPIPECPDLAVQAVLSKGKVSSGVKVILTVNVVNTGAAALDGVNVGLTSPLVANWQTPLKDKVPFVKAGNSVYWLDQDLRPGKREAFQAKAWVCSGVEEGWQPLAAAMVYRLNATGGVACMTTVDTNAVRQSLGEPFFAAFPPVKGRDVEEYHVNDVMVHPAGESVALRQEKCCQSPPLRLNAAGAKCYLPHVWNQPTPCRRHGRCPGGGAGAPLAPHSITRATWRALMQASSRPSSLRSTRARGRATGGWHCT